MVSGLIKLTSLKCINVSSDKKKVTHNLADFLNAKVKGQLSKDALTATRLIITK